MLGLALLPLRRAARSGATRDRPARLVHQPPAERFVELGIFEGIANQHLLSTGDAREDMKRELLARARAASCDALVEVPATMVGSVCGNDPCPAHGGFLRAVCIQWVR